MVLISVIKYKKKPKSKFFENMKWPDLKKFCAFYYFYSNKKIIVPIFHIWCQNVATACFEESEECHIGTLSVI